MYDYESIRRVQDFEASIGIAWTERGFEKLPIEDNGESCLGVQPHELGQSNGWVETPDSEGDWLVIYQDRRENICKEFVPVVHIGAGDALAEGFYVRYAGADSLIDADWYNDARWLKVNWPTVGEGLG